MNRSHPNFGNKTKIGERTWWKMLIKGTKLKKSEEVSNCVRKKNSLKEAEKNMLRFFSRRMQKPLKELFSSFRYI